MGSYERSKFSYKDLKVKIKQRPKYTHNDNHRPFTDTRLNNQHHHLLLCELCDLDLPRRSVALSPAGHVDCVAKETVARHPQAHHTSHHGTAVDPDTHL